MSWSACSSSSPRRVLPELVDALAQLDEADHPAAPLLREVGAGEERAAVGRAHHGHRPAALAGHGLGGLHVDVVDVGPLLAVDLHVHEQPVHHRGDVRRPRRTRGPSRGTSGRPSSRSTRGPGRRARAASANASSPHGLPVDRVVGVLAEVGAGLLGEAVRGRPSHEARAQRGHAVAGSSSSSDGGPVRTGDEERERWGRGPDRSVTVRPVEVGRLEAKALLVRALREEAATTGLAARRRSRALARSGRGIGARASSPSGRRMSTPCTRTSVSGASSPKPGGPQPCIGLVPEQRRRARHPMLRAASAVEQLDRTRSGGSRCARRTAAPCRATDRC